MAKIFISYSRADSLFIGELVPLLVQVFPNHEIWFDEHITGGEDWWQRILREIARCDLFVYLLSNDSLESEYCQAEFREALRLQKLCLPVIVRPKTNINNAPTDLEPEIRRRNWIDMSGGFKDARANAKLYNAITRQLSELSPEPLPPLAEAPIAKPNVSQAAKATGRSLSTNQIALIVAVLGLIGTVSAAIITGFFGLLDNTISSQTTPTSTTGIVVVSTAADSQTVEASETPSATPTATATNTATASITPPPTATLDIALVVATLDAEATLGQATLNAQSTAAARATEYAAGTQSAVDQTATATLWTHTPTPDITASIDAFRTQQAATVTQAWIDSWTDTPTPTHTPSNTPTATATYTPTLTVTPTATLSELDAALARARAFTGTNADWTPFTWTFEDGVEMALVPAGCFMMGSEDGQDDERPVHQQCFTEPFWIDRTEVTNAQYGSTGCEDWSSEPSQPRNCITWFEARDFCALRGARLPTEREWEYAARGPANWVYPWRDVWDENNAVWSGNSNSQTAEVGSRPAGASWVGALDMSGNVWEWTSSLYEPYPYDAADGREADTGSRTDVLRVLRGGSFYASTNFLRAPYRNWSAPDYEGFFIGVRCARSLE